MCFLIDPRLICVSVGYRINEWHTDNVKIRTKLSGFIKTTKGLRQGCSLSHIRGDRAPGMEKSLLRNGHSGQ